MRGQGGANQKERARTDQSGKDKEGPISMRGQGGIDQKERAKRDQSEGEEEER